MDNQVSHMELRLQIQLNRYVGHSIVRLPPGPVLIFPFRSWRIPLVHNILDAMRLFRSGTFAFRSGIAIETFLLFGGAMGAVQMGKNAIFRFAF